MARAVLTSFPTMSRLRTFALDSGSINGSGEERIAPRMLDLTKRKRANNLNIVFVTAAQNLKRVHFCVNIQIELPFCNVQKLRAYGSYCAKISGIAIAALSS